MKTPRECLAIISLVIVGCSDGPTATPGETATPVDLVAFSHIAVPGINIDQVDEGDFLTLFPNPPIGALGSLLIGPNTDPDDTLWFDGDTRARLQSAVYEGVGSAAGLFAYLYQVDCTGGNVAPMVAEIPLSGATLNTTAAGLSTTAFGYIATLFQAPTPFESLPSILYTGSLVNFNLSEFGAGSGIGGNTAAGFTDAAQVGDLVVVGSTTDNFWSGTIVLFITDVAPVITFAEITTGVAPGFPTSVAVLAPSPGVGTPDVPSGDIITDPPEVDPVILVDLDVKPGSDPNALNTKSKGQLPIGIYGSDTFDVRDIDVSTIKVECMGTTTDNLRVAYEDLVVVDGIEDLMLHVPIQNFPWGAPRGTEVRIVVSGLLLDGSAFVGEDVVLIVK